MIASDDIRHEMSETERELRKVYLTCRNEEHRPVLKRALEFLYSARAIIEEQVKKDIEK
jgi:hypothetical protein